MNDAALETVPAGQSAPLSERPLRVLFTSYRSNPHTGGQGVYLRQASKALVDLGHEVSVASGPPYPKLDPRVDLIRLPSLDLYDRPRSFMGMPPPPWASFGDGLNLYEYISHITGAFPEPFTFGERLARFLRRNANRFDVVHDNQTLAPGLLKAARRGLPIIGMIHHPITVDRQIAIDTAETPGMKGLVRHWYSFVDMQKRVARQLDPIIVVSRQTHDDVIEAFGLDAKRLRLLYHGIDHDFWRPVPQIARDRRMLMAVASADVPLKGLIYLIEAYARILTTHPDIGLTIVGALRDGPTKDRLRELGLLGRVNFLSGLSDNELRDLYARATIAVSPSLYEGFGLPAAEAMSCEVPVIATTGGALPEVVGTAGLLVPTKDADALCRAITYLLDNPEQRQRLGRMGRKRIVEKFLWQRAAREMTQLYQESIETHANSAHFAS